MSAAASAVNTEKTELPPAVFKQKVLQELFAARDARVNGPAARLLGEYLRLFTAEAVHRAAAAAREAGEDEIDTRHIKQVLAELLLDF